MRKELEDLKQAAERLNATTELVNKTLSFVQGRLEASQVGIEFWLPYSLDGWQLGYDKRQLVVRAVRAKELPLAQELVRALVRAKALPLSQELIITVPLLSAERGVRAKALPLLQELVMELARAAAEMSNEMEVELEKI